MSVLVLEDYNENQEVSWGVSFTDNNPEMKDYVECASKGDAFKLEEKIKKLYIDKNICY